MTQTSPLNDLDHSLTADSNTKTSPPIEENLSLNSFPLFFRRYLYEVEFELKDSTIRSCLFTRTYIQDADLYNLCVKGTKRSFIAPVRDTVEVFENWELENKLREMDDERTSNFSQSSSSSLEETRNFTFHFEKSQISAEQIQMKAMGLPMIFGETKKKQNKQARLKDRINEFFRLTNNLGYVGGVNSSSSKTFGPTKIQKFKYKYKSERSSKVPRYRFVGPPDAAGDKHIYETDDNNGIGAMVSEFERISSVESDSQNDEEESVAEEEVEPVAVMSQVLEDYDFGYDSERDGHLIAANAKSSVVWSKQVVKYWHQRYRLFSKLDEGILMDREGWFSVTPERVAEHIAQRMVNRPGAIILDAFTGVGGNAIQFAKQGAYVYAIDLDPIKIRCARRNAEIYGVLDRITFICGDFFNVAASFLGSRSNKSKNSSFVPNTDESPYGIDAIFLSPPWGGPTYEQSDFDIETSMGGLNGVEIFRLAERISPNIGYFLPRNTASAQIIELANVHHKVEIEQSFLNGKNKAITAYYGNLAK
ncbi:Trimethylguanosine synthase [Aphelenchoides besseyi]|nr:Trimethylguanosine synthase [Aphelenchoides besseyi]